MLEEGLVKEVEGLKREGCHRGMVSMQGLGYKGILAYLEGEYPLERGGTYPETRYQTFCKTPADLVSAGVGCDLG